jgi:hypothetical protein
MCHLFILIFLFLVHDLPPISSEICAIVLILLIGGKLASGPSCSLGQPPLAGSEIHIRKLDGCNV